MRNVNDLIFRKKSRTNIHFFLGIFILVLKLVGAEIDKFVDLYKFLLFS